jgi:tRNA(Ile)-lysidine synthase
MKGSKKVSDYLTDKKVSQLERGNTYVLISDKDIIWIIGHVINEKYKTLKNSETSYKLVYKIMN